MANASHTPGPWAARPAPYGFDIFNPELSLWVGSTATPLGKESPFYPPKEAVEANACLIAAAPDMLEVCSGFATWTDDEGNIYLQIAGRTVFSAPIESDEGRRLTELGDKRRTAIAKAESRP